MYELAKREKQKRRGKQYLEQKYAHSVFSVLYDCPTNGV